MIVRAGTTSQVRFIKGLLVKFPIHATIVHGDGDDTRQMTSPQRRLTPAAATLDLAPWYKV